YDQALECFGNALRSATPDTQTVMATQIAVHHDRRGYDEHISKLLPPFESAARDRGAGNDVEYVQADLIQLKKMVNQRDWGPLDAADEKALALYQAANGKVNLLSHMEEWR